MGGERVGMPNRHRKSHIQRYKDESIEDTNGLRPVGRIEATILQDHNGREIRQAAHRDPMESVKHRETGKGTVRKVCVPFYQKLIYLY